MKTGSARGRNPLSDKGCFRSIEEVARLTGWAPNTVRKYLKSGAIKIKKAGQVEAFLAVVHAVHDERSDLRAGSVECRKEYVDLNAN